MALLPLNAGVARLAKTMPCFVRRNIIGLTCSPELSKYGMLPWEGQFRDSPARETPRWTTDTPPATPAPVPISAIYGLLPSMPSGGTANILGTQYINPATVMSINSVAAAVAFKVPYAITIVGISVTMAAALVAGHTISFQYTIAGVDSAAILLALAVGNIDGTATGTISVPASTSIVIKAVQAGGGGDNIQSLVMIYQ